MARILPSGRVFGEISRLPNIQYAKEEHPLATLERASKSNLASIAVAGIDRIRKEIALNEAEEAEAKRLAETRRKLEELKREGAAWEAHAAREAEARQAAQAPTMPARPMVPVERGTMPSPETQRVIEAAGGQILPTQHPGPLRAGGPVATRPGEVQWAALTPEQRAFAHAVHSHPLAPKHLQQQAVAHGSDMQGDRRYGWGQHSENTLAEIQAAGLVWDGSRFVAQQPQAVVAEESIYAPAREQRLADINEQMAALQKQMQPMPTPRTGAEFIYAVMQETDPRRRAALLSQARNAIGDSPATIQEAMSGAATMRMQEKMLKGMSLADAAALAAKEFKVKEDELKVKQRTVAAKEKREANYAKRVEAENKLTQARVNKLEREEREASRKAARATGASRRAHEKRAAIARVIRMHHTKQLDDGRATAEIYEIPGISRGEIKNAVAIITKKQEAWDELAAEEAKADALELRHHEAISSREAIAEANREAAAARVERSAQIRAKAASDRAKAARDLEYAKARLRSITDHLDHAQDRLRLYEATHPKHPTLWKKAEMEEEGPLYGIWLEHKKIEREIKVLRRNRAEATDELNKLGDVIRGADAVINAPPTEGTPIMVFGDPK